MKQNKWHLPAPQVDLRNFKLKKINEPQYKHLWLLLFWPIYWLRYPIVEAINTEERCFLMHTVLDEHIPFCELFIVPYGLWLAIMLGINLYMAFYDVDTFKKYTKFLIISISISTLTFLVFPTYQDLRPETFPRDNVFTRLVSFVYAADTNTNVCPSEHVIGSFAFWAAAINSKRFQTPGRITAVTIAAVLTSIATLFLKQHSVIDVIVAIPVCLIVYRICYGKLHFTRSNSGDVSCTA